MKTFEVHCVKRAHADFNDSVEHLSVLKAARGMCSGNAEDAAETAKVMTQAVETMSNGQRTPMLVEDSLWLWQRHVVSFCGGGRNGPLLRRSLLALCSGWACAYCETGRHCSAASAFNKAHFVSMSVRCSTGLCGWGGQLARAAGTGCWAEQLRLAIGLCNWAAGLTLGRAAGQCS